MATAGICSESWPEPTPGQAWGSSCCDPRTRTSSRRETIFWVSGEASGPPSVGRAGMQLSFKLGGQGEERRGARGGGKETAQTWKIFGGTASEMTLTRVRVRAQVWLRKAPLPPTTSGSACSSERVTVQAKMAEAGRMPTGLWPSLSADSLSLTTGTGTKSASMVRECGMPHGAVRPGRPSQQEGTGR